MARFVVGDVVIVPFPFSDLSEPKRCPALVIAVSTGGDFILCQFWNYAIDRLTGNRSLTKPFILPPQTIDRLDGVYRPFDRFALGSAL